VLEFSGFVFNEDSLSDSASTGKLCEDSREFSYDMFWQEAPE